MSVEGAHLVVSKAEVTGNTAITPVWADQADHQCYNLAGQKVGSNFKGLVIRNGRKYLQR
jgi:hypothetical protein